MVLIYQVLTRECLKKVFLTSNDFVTNDSSLLKFHIGDVGILVLWTVLWKILWWREIWWCKCHGIRVQKLFMCLHPIWLQKMFKQLWLQHKDKVSSSYLGTHHSTCMHRLKNGNHKFSPPHQILGQKAKRAAKVNVDQPPQIESKILLTIYSCFYSVTVNSHWFGQ